MTATQSGIAACLLDALCNKEIARAMDMSVDSVEWQIYRMCAKFKARNRVQLALILQRMA